MNSTEYRQARHAEYRAVIDTCYPIATGLITATTEERKAAIHACNFASDKWAVDQKHANTMAQAELDAATAKGCEEVVEETATQDFATMTTAELREYAETVQAEYDADELTGPMGRQIVRDAWARVEAAEAAEVTTPTAAEVVATLDTSEVFGTAWGADGQVLSYDETVEAIAKGDGWFDREGRWVNKAGWEKKHAGLGAWLTAKLAE